MLFPLCLTNLASRVQVDGRRAGLLQAGTGVRGFPCWERRTLEMPFSASVPELSQQQPGGLGHSNRRSASPLQESRCRPSTAARGTCWMLTGTLPWACILEPLLQPSGQSPGAQVLGLLESRLAKKVCDKLSLLGIYKMEEREKMFSWFAVMCNCALSMTCMPQYEHLKN